MRPGGHVKMRTDCAKPSGSAQHLRGRTLTLRIDMARFWLEEMS